MKCKEIHLRSFEDDRGILTVLETGSEIPFDVKRVFTLTHCSAVRGGHVNPGAYVLVPVCGTFFVTVKDADFHTEWTGYLSEKRHGLYVPSDMAVTLNLFSVHAVCLVLSDWHYAEAKR